MSRNRTEREKARAQKEEANATKREGEAYLVDFVVNKLVGLFRSLDDRGDDLHSKVPEVHRAEKRM